MEKYILWDWNGTLLDDVTITMQSANTLLKKYHLPQIKSLEEYRKKFFFPIEAYYKTLGFNFSKTPYNQLAQEFIEIYQSLLSQCQLNNQAQKILQFFQEQGFKQIIISASKKEPLIAQVCFHKIDHYFQQILGIETIYAKSKIHIAQNWQQEHCIQAKNMVFIGDTFHDYEVAKALNCFCILYQNGHQLVTKKDAPKANFISSLWDASLFL